MWNKIKKFIIKNKKCIIYAFIFSVLVIPFIFIFISLNKSWADGMSVAALIYICLGFFIIILDISPNILFLFCVMQVFYKAYYYN